MEQMRARALYALRTTWSGLLATPVTCVVAILTIALCLLLVGNFALLVVNMEQILDRFGEEFRISAYLEDDLEDDVVAALRAKLNSAPGVERVEWVTKEQALERFRSSEVGRAALIEGLDANPLPASLELILLPADRNEAGIERLAEALTDLPGIADLGYGADWVAGYGRAVGLVRSVGLAIGGVLVLATLLIVTNTIRLALYTRRDEVEILRLVGASRTFVAVPYLMEGFVQGCLGGVVGLLLLAGFFHTVLPGVSGSLELVLGHVKPVFLDGSQALGLVSTGAALGMIGSAAALLQGRLDG